MKYLLSLILYLSLFSSLQAQTLEGNFSIQGKEEASSTIALTAIAGQPFEGTAVGSLLSYGFTEMVAVANEYTNVTALTLGQNEASVEVGSSLKLAAAFSPEEVDNPVVSWFSSDPSVATVKDGAVSALKAGVTTVTVVSAGGLFTDQCAVTVKTAATSIEQVESGDKVYPTVVKDDLYLNLQAKQTVYIVNLSGKICEVFDAQPGINRVPMLQYPSGIYFVRMNDRAVKVVKCK